jgi:integration host factor subunit beta
MTKTELIKEVADRVDISQKQAREVVNGVFESMKYALLDDDRIELRGFGSFQVREDDAYETTNPKTGKKMPVGPRKKVHFKVGKELEQRVDTLNEYDD